MRVELLCIVLLPICCLLVIVSWAARIELNDLGPRRYCLRYRSHVRSYPDLHWCESLMPRELWVETPDEKLDRQIHRQHILMRRLDQIRLSALTVNDATYINAPIFF